MMHKKYYVLTALFASLGSLQAGQIIKKKPSVKPVVETAKQTVAPAPIEAAKQSADAQQAPTATELAALDRQADSLQQRLDAVKAQLAQAHKAVGKLGKKSKKNFTSLI